MIQKYRQFVLKERKTIEKPTHFHDKKKHTLKAPKKENTDDD